MATKYPSHKTQFITYGSQAANVDCGIAPLILALWRRRFRTLFCCEGWPEFINGVTEKAYITFANEADWFRFVKLYGRFMVWFETCPSRRDGQWSIYFAHREIRLLVRRIGQERQLRAE